MKTIKVERAEQKTIKYEKDGQQKSFIKYGALSVGIWYQLKGFGKDNVKAGDTISGEYVEQDWESGGKSGTNRILTLLDQITVDILQRIEDLEHTVASLMIKENTMDEKPKVEDNDDLPF